MHIKPALSLSPEDGHDFKIGGLGLWVAGVRSDGCDNFGSWLGCMGMCSPEQRAGRRGPQKALFRPLRLVYEPWIQNGRRRLWWLHCRKARIRINWRAHDGVLGRIVTLSSVGERSQTEASP